MTVITEKIEWIECPIDANPLLKEKFELQLKKLIRQVCFDVNISEGKITQRTTDNKKRTMRLVFIHEEDASDFYQECHKTISVHRAGDRILILDFKLNKTWVIKHYPIILDVLNKVPQPSAYTATTEKLDDVPTNNNTLPVSENGEAASETKAGIKEKEAKEATTFVKISQKASDAFDKSTPRGRGLVVIPSIENHMGDIPVTNTPKSQRLLNKGVTYYFVLNHDHRSKLIDYLEEIGFECHPAGKKGIYVMSTTIKYADPFLVKKLKERLGFDVIDDTAKAETPAVESDTGQSETPEFDLSGWDISKWENDEFYWIDEDIQNIWKSLPKNISSHLLLTDMNNEVNEDVFSITENLATEEEGLINIIPTTTEGSDEVVTYLKNIEAKYTKENGVITLLSLEIEYLSVSMAQALKDYVANPQNGVTTESEVTPETAEEAVSPASENGEVVETETISSELGVSQEVVPITDFIEIPEGLFKLFESMDLRNRSTIVLAAIRNHMAGLPLRRGKKTRALNARKVVYYYTTPNENRERMTKYLDGLGLAFETSGEKGVLIMSHTPKFADSFLKEKLEEKLGMTFDDANNSSATAQESSETAGSKGARPIAEVDGVEHPKPHVGTAAVETPVLDPEKATETLASENETPSEVTESTTPEPQKGDSVEEASGLVQMLFGKIVDSIDKAQGLENVLENINDLEKISSKNLEAAKKLQGMLSRKRQESIDLITTIAAKVFWKYLKSYDTVVLLKDGIDHSTNKEVIIDDLISLLQKKLDKKL